MVEVLDCEPVPSSVRSARLFVVDKLQEWRCDDLVDGAALLTSELATNAVKHTNQPFQVAVEKDGDRIRVEVADATSERPTPYTEADDLGLYHGLNVVDSLATDWGCEDVPNGKIVWFELDGALADDDAGGIASLRDLRSPEPDEGLPEAVGGKELPHPPSQEATEMATREDLIEERDKLRDQRDSLLEERDRRGDDRRFYEDEESHRSPIWKVILALLIVAVIAAVAFFALGGSADVDTEGDLEVPSVDVDVNAPDVDVNSEEAPPASANAEADAEQTG